MEAFKSAYGFNDKTKTKAKKKYFIQVCSSCVFTEGFCEIFLAKFLPSKVRVQKQPSRGAPNKRCSENMQQIHSGTPIPKFDFNKVALQLYWNCTSAWVFPCKLAAYFPNTFS